MRLARMVFIHIGFLLFPILTVFAKEQAAVTELSVEGERREAMIVPPAKRTEKPVPVILVFHGHGGTIESVERYDFQKYWPEAVIVYPQRLPTVTGRDPEGKQPGWQQKVAASNDRDIKFVDAILRHLRERFRVDDARVFATGHSNGGVFTYLLGMVRSKVFAAIAPSAAVAGGLWADNDAKPIPVMHIAGRNDNVVPFEYQQKTLEAVCRRNVCETKGIPWATAGDLTGTLYPSKAGASVVSVVHPGSHKYPENAIELIVRFFKERVSAG
ncbi:MAG: prolyl oligopeptidase family serine peptidase [Chlorobium sp.]|jgi:polyhydroxybutyrate depolymerase|nr:prolyl oligopeptidase family serine peptidase [Chlorobium sp.]